MNIKETDSIDGKTLERQSSILLTHIGLLVGSWILLVGFEWLVFNIAGYGEQAVAYIKNIQPLTLLIWGLIWISLAPKGYVNPKGNHIQATHNSVSVEQFEDGGTRFIVYGTGIALKYLWEELQGEELTVENEVSFESALTTVSIKKISLEMKLSFLYRVHLPRLSAYLQNRTEKDGLTGIINQLKAASNQYIEEAASKMDDTEEVRQDQTSIINTMLERLKPEACHFGIDILTANFIRCDYSADTQKELNKLLESQSIQKIADDMGLEDRGRAMELAAVLNGKPGAKVTRSIYEVVMAPDVADAVKTAVPASVALISAKILEKPQPEKAESKK